MEYPRMMRIKQTLEDRALENIPQEIKTQFEGLGLEETVIPGQTVAIACSSRGIANYGVIVKTVIACLKKLELEPFLIPAMGSHGAATAAGQKRVLEHLGIDEKDVSASIRSSLDVVQLGETEDHIPVYLDKLAHAADHIVLINRIKKHTEFEHEFESGLLKMMAIGLGKQKGAATYHEAMLTYGYPRVILTIAHKVIQHANILLGVGIVEDGHGQTASIGICRAREIEATEKKLFKMAKKFAPGLPLEAADILIIDEMGKDISGTGFDTKVVGRIGLPLLSEEPQSPRIKRIVVCDLTQQSEGNAVGVGIADMITQRLFDKIDMEAFNMNTLTGVCPEMGKIPLTLKNDREAINAAIKCVGLIPVEKLKIMRIKNTSYLGELDISEAYAEELVKREDLEDMTGKRHFQFDLSGNLEPF